MNWASAFITCLSTPPETPRAAAAWRPLVATLTGLAGLLVLPVAAHADLVTLRGGRVLNVAAVAFDGDTVVLTLRTGGQLRAPRDFVVEVTPDEVPWPEPEPDPAVAAPEASAPDEADVDVSADALHVLITRMATEAGVDARLAHAVVRVESNYQADAVSPKGAMGLMQLMPATARQYDVVNPFDPAQNLAAGLRHLRGLLDRYGRGKEALALAAYNAGEGAVRRYQGIPPYRETRQYVERILSLTRR